jgi:GGDEF domain-containing protein
MNNGYLSVLKSVGNIVEERNKCLLEQLLLSGVAQFVDFDALILLQAPSREDNPYLEVTFSLPREAYNDKLKPLTHANGATHIHMDDAIQQCIKTSQTLVLNINNTERAIFPIIIRNEVVAVLDVYTEKLIDTHQQIIMGFMHIYRQYVEVLYDNEHDTLTGLLNRKTFDDRLKGFYSDAQLSINPDYTLDKDLRHPHKGHNHWWGLSI